MDSAASTQALLRACTLAAAVSCLLACQQSAWCPVGRDGWDYEGDGWDHEEEEAALVDACNDHPATAPRAADVPLLVGPLGCGAERELCQRGLDETPRAYADRLWAEGNRVGPGHPTLAVGYYLSSLREAPDEARARYVAQVFAELDRPFEWVAAPTPPTEVYTSLDELCGAVAGDAQSRCHLASDWRRAKEGGGAEHIAQLRVGRMSDFGATHYLVSWGPRGVRLLLLLGEEDEGTRSPDLEHLSVQIMDWPLPLGDQVGVVWASMRSDEPGCRRPISRTLARCDFSDVPRCTEFVDLGPVTEWPPESMPRTPAALETCQPPIATAALGEGTPPATSYTARFSVHVTNTQLVATRSWDGWRACSPLEATVVVE